MAVTLAGNALTTISALENELNITSENSYLSRLINQASSDIEKACNRKFEQAIIVDEKQPGYGNNRLYVNRIPITELTTIKYLDTIINSTEYELDDDGASGIIYGAWLWTAASLDNILQDQVAGSEKKSYKISYTGGYVLPKNAIAGSVIGTIIEDFVFSLDSELIFVSDFGTTTVPIIAGTYTAVEIKTLIDAAISFGDVSCSADGGIVTITCIGDDSTNYLQVTSNSAAATLGLDSDNHSGTRTLPWDLERACLDIAINAYRSKGANSTITSESILTARVSYGKVMFSEYVNSVIKRYKRVTLI